MMSTVAAAKGAKNIPQKDSVSARRFVILLGNKEAWASIEQGRGIRRKRRYLPHKVQDTKQIKGGSR